MRAASWGLALAAALGAALPATAGALSDAARRVSVVAEPGKSAQVRAALGRSALRVVRRRGRVLEVMAPPAKIATLARLPGVDAAHEATVPFADAVTTEGVRRTGANGVLDVADGGRGLTIAVLDLGFGTGIDSRQAAKELPPDSRLELVSFDPVSGIAGRNAYGNATNHGELVAQTVFDYAPLARYAFVSYHSETDFLAAVDWLVARRPDIVVHSNSFIEGSFDGTGPEARAVDRAAAAGVLWFNSAGNYAESHWSGAWVDANGDGTLDLGGDGLFERPAGAPITFALSWSSPPGSQAAGAATDLDLVLERLSPAGTWDAVADSTGVQAASGDASERIVGQSAGVGGTFRVRVAWAGGPEPVGPITLFSREVKLGAMGGLPGSSVPTPGDAAGSITVGAVDWRGDLPKAYSSQGPTLDGRLKPDVVAPTNTRVLGASGPRSIGGTSNAAPNAAGVAAALLAARRAAGIPFDYQEVRAALETEAFDLGAPGPDPQFGAGRVRTETDPPAILLEEPRPGASLRRRAVIRPIVDDESDIARWSISVDGVHLTARRGPVAPIRINTRRFGDGGHVLEIRAIDFPGNEGTSTFRLQFDNTPPTLTIGRVEVLGRSAPPTTDPGDEPPARVEPPRRPVRVSVAASDAGGRPLTVALRLTSRSAGVVAQKTIVTRATAGRRVVLGRHPAGVYRLTAVATDAAGNVRTTRRRVLVR